MKKIIDDIAKNNFTSKENLIQLVSNFDREILTYANNTALEIKQSVYGKKVFIRGLIEFTNFCKNDCFYCGIRISNKNIERYRLTKDDILECCNDGYELGFRTFVLQGGEDLSYKDDDIANIVKEIKTKHSNCAVTLSFGERSYDSYKLFKDAGADRYLLRHETASKNHYQKLHPQKMSYENRIECLHNLKRIGYQTGTGFMIGSPYQTAENIYEDLKFIHDFSPEMVGIGPYIPHHQTPFKDEKPGSKDLTLLLLSIIRMIHPKVLLPSTTALGTIDSNGRILGILAGANVIMPNLSPSSVRKKYMIYDNKVSTGEEAAEGLAKLKMQINNIGFEIVTDRGDALS